MTWTTGMSDIICNASTVSKKMKAVTANTSQPTVVFQDSHNCKEKTWGAKIPGIKKIHIRAYTSL